MSVNCPSCGGDLVVPEAKAPESGDHLRIPQQTKGPISQTSTELRHLSPAKSRKPIIMVVVSSGLVVAIAVGVVVANRTKPKSEAQVVANQTHEAPVVNPTSIGGRLTDFVEKFGGGDSVAVVATARLNYDYRGFAIGERTVLVVGCDDDGIVACGVIFRHDGRKSFNAVPLENPEIADGLKIFSRHDGVDWSEAPADGGNPRIWGYLATEESLKWGRSPLMAIYTSEIPYLIVFSTDSDRASYKKLGEDMRHWKIYAPNRSESQ